MDTADSAAGREFVGSRLMGPGAEGRAGGNGGSLCEAAAVLGHCLQ